MSNIVDYVRQHGDSFEERPLCRVDSLVLCWLAFTRIAEEVPEAGTDEGLALAQLGSRSSLIELVAPINDPRGSEELLRACADSPRFASVVASRAVDEWSRTEECQFSAITFLLPTGAAFAAFRGTDNTLVGWKESFNMAFLPAIPAQRRAAEYLDRVAAETTGSLYAGGHSKGGNLAAYAASMCGPAARVRLARVFCHDAPGFTEAALSQQGWLDATALIDRTVPEESLVGLLLNPYGPDADVVRSTQRGVFQHAPLSWVVDGTDFATTHGVTYDAHRTGKRLRAWLATMNAASRERYAGILFRLAEASGAVTVSGLAQGLQDGSLSLVLQRLDGLPEGDRAFFAEATDDLAATLLLGPAPASPQTAAERFAMAADKVDDAAARFNDAASRLDRYAGL